MFINIRDEHIHLFGSRVQQKVSVENNSSEFLFPRRASILIT